MTPPTTSLEYPETTENEDHGQWSKAHPLTKVLRTNTVKVIPRVRRARHSDKRRLRSKLLAKLRRTMSLEKGWNGYEAAPPTWIAYGAARELLRSMFRAEILPVRVAPSVVGGIGVTAMRDDREVYIEVSNLGTVHAVYSRGTAEPDIESYTLSESGIAALIARMRDHLDG